MLVISGVSGSGKTSVCHGLLTARPERYLLSVSSTTRPRRRTETDGVDYLFVEEEAFRAAVERGEFLEHAQVFRQLYGTPRRNLEEARAEGRVLLLDIDVQGGARLRASGIPALLVWLELPAPEVAAARLRGRGTDSEEEIAHRLEVARREVEAAQGLYDVFLVNDDLGQVIRQIDMLVEERLLQGARSGESA
jgi:guanylate kinase